MQDASARIAELEQAVVELERERDEYMAIADPVAHFQRVLVLKLCNREITLQDFVALQSASYVHLFVQIPDYIGLQRNVIRSCKVGGWGDFGDISGNLEAVLPLLEADV